MPKHLRLLLLLCALCTTKPLQAQAPFYRDDTSVTEPVKLHFEFFNEFDILQHPLHPNLRQNTVNYKLNCGLPYTAMFTPEACRSCMTSLRG